jgi:hypothetical protein
LRRPHAAELQADEEAGWGTRLPDEAWKLVIYRAFVEGELEVPKHLARQVHNLYFNPQVEAFAPRMTCSLSNELTRRQEAPSDSPVQGDRKTCFVRRSNSGWPKLIPQLRASLSSGAIGRGRKTRKPSSDPTNLFTDRVLQDCTRIEGRVFNK